MSPKGSAPAPKGGGSQVARPQQRRWSLRLRIIGSIVFVALAPQLLVIAWSLVDRGVPASNGSLVARAREIVERMGASVATAAEVRAKLGLTKQK